ncbi:hypothetical protein [Pseudophaeobacter sp. EL27]|uniref:hypothetical protein n=1 Tax=Pseudophaeobacter sp. EL27 TaxID=2107580 RepID=UPI000EFAA54F|nr:hypothetical protein [Pseudophaeobacter sp. EL27]
MIGIVLWSDATAGNAVIWCEDQGDLAFYSHVSAPSDFAIRVGDWVLFELKLKDDLRLALNIQVLQEPACPELAADLVGASTKANVASALRLVEPEGRRRNIPVHAAQATGNKPGDSVQLSQANAVQVKVKEGLPKPGNVGSLATDGASQNIIPFPSNGAGRLRRA